MGALMMSPETPQRVPAIRHVSLLCPLLRRELSFSKVWGRHPVGPSLQLPLMCL